MLITRQPLCPLKLLAARVEHLIYEVIGEVSMIRWNKAVYLSHCPHILDYTLVWCRAVGWKFPGFLFAREVESFETCIGMCK